MLISNYGAHLLLPEKDFENFTRPERFIPNSIGHHEEWIRACKTGEPSTCNFAYSGALTESVLLGNVAFRAGARIDWDAAKLRARGCAAATEFVQHHYRRGWKI